MKRKGLLLIYGFVLISIWSICFLGAGMSDSYTAAMGLSFTFLSIYFLQKEYEFKLSISDKFVILAFPIVHLCSIYFVLFDNNYFAFRSINFVALYQLLFYLHLINPVVIAFLVLLLGLTKLKDLSNPRNIFIFISITIFYSYFFHSTWLNRWLWRSRANFDTEILKESGGQNSEKLEISHHVNLSNFSFINAGLDTTTLINSSDKYILLETWSENCVPCIRAMKELPAFYRSIQNKVDVYYVYESNKERVRNNFDKIFTFKEIEDKSKILIDINQNLYNALNMRGFPYFLLFDSKGKLIYHNRGYLGKNAQSSQISEQIQ